MGTESNISKVRELIEEGFSRGNVQVADRLVALDCIERQRGQKPGADGVKETIRTLHRWFSDFRLVVEEVVADGDRVWTRNTATGVNTGEVMGMAPTGKPIEITVFDEVRFDNGVIVEHWGVADQLGMLLQLGMIPRHQKVATGG